MDHFSYTNGVLHAEDVPLPEIAASVGTPVYVVDEADLRARARAFADAFAGWEVYYAAKSFLCTAVARWVAAEGLGVVLVPLFLVVDDIISGRLCAPFGLLAPMRRQYFFNVPSSSQKSEVASIFCDWLLREGRDTETSIDAWSAEMGWTPEPGHG